MAEWRVYEADIPQCTHCVMWMPFARYRRGQGTDAREITDFFPSCGKKMTAMPMCGSCAYGNGEWKDDGICFACREQVWIPGKPHRQVGNEKSRPNCAKMDLEEMLRWLIGSIMRIAIYALRAGMSAITRTKKNMGLVYVLYVAQR